MITTNFGKFAFASIILSMALLGACSNTVDITFDHGVASGDPLHDRMIIWTRVTPVSTDDMDEQVEVTWEVARTADFAEVELAGTSATNADRDFTVKVDVSGLSADTRYFYRFRVGDTLSDAGKTKTAPTGHIDQINLAAVSCSNYPAGYFNVYRAVADRTDLDAVLHLGDYYYEYAPGEYGAENAAEMGRSPLPGHEIISLDDYRKRHAQYRSDPDLQAMTAAHPLIVVWDDHETANNSYKDGAQNHTDSDGVWEDRKRNAIQAYHEWLPVRVHPSDDTGRIYRSFRYGDLADVIMLDTRLFGRDEQLDYSRDLVYLSYPFDFTDPDNPIAIEDSQSLKSVNEADIKTVKVPFDISGEKPTPVLDYARIKAMDPDDLPDGFAYLPDRDRFFNEFLDDPDRTMLGAEQEEWLRRQLIKSKDDNIRWQILGQQLLVGEVIVPDLGDRLKPHPDFPFMTKARIALIKAYASVGLPLNLDAWDGYPAARRRLARDILEHGANVIILSGDTHNGWAINLDQGEGTIQYAAEFGVPGVTSDGMEAIFPVDSEIVEEAIYISSRQINYVNASDRGYLVLNVTPSNATGRWHYVDTITDRNFTTLCETAMAVAAKDGPGVHQIREVPCD